MDRRLFALALLAAAACVRGTPPAETPSPAAAPAAPRVLRIIATNDFHGAFESRPDAGGVMRGGAVPLAAAIDRARRECAPGCVTLLLDGGDEFQGTPASNLAFGRPVVELFNLLGYTAGALGNHEFDWSQDTLRARMREARYRILGANVRYADGRDVEWIPDDTLVRLRGATVGIIGVATTLTPQTTKASNVADLRFVDPAPVVDERARALRARGATHVVIVAHEGAFCGRDGWSDCRGEIVDLASRTTERIDAIVSGHTHSFVDVVVRGIPIVQTRSSGRALGIIDLPLGASAAADSATGHVRDVVADSASAGAADPRVVDLVRRALASVAERVSRPVAQIAEPMRRSGSQFALGNLLADAMRAAGQGDVAVMNNGGIRADLQAGTATYGTLFEISPFANVLVRLRVRGSDLRAYLEQRLSRAEPSDHFSGVAVTYSTARPAGSRIESVTVGGRPLDPAAEYSVIINDFMATGGDGHGLARGAISMQTLDVVDLDALIAHLRALPQPVRPPSEWRLTRTGQ